MSCTLNREAFRILIAEDLDWLLKQPRSLERDHIECALRDAERTYYERAAREWAQAEKHAAQADAERHKNTADTLRAQLAAVTAELAEARRQLAGAREDSARQEIADALRAEAAKEQL